LLALATNVVIDDAHDGAVDDASAVPNAVVARCADADNEAPVR
jgi:hypothetical protein